MQEPTRTPVFIKFIKDEVVWCSDCGATCFNEFCLYWNMDKDPYIRVDAAKHRCKPCFVQWWKSGDAQLWRNRYLDMWGHTNCAFMECHLHDHGAYDDD